MASTPKNTGEGSGSGAGGATGANGQAAKTPVQSTPRSFLRLRRLEVSYNDMLTPDATPSSILSSRKRRPTRVRRASAAAKRATATEAAMVRLKLETAPGVGSQRSGRRGRGRGRTVGVVPHYLCMDMGLAGYDNAVMDTDGSYLPRGSRRVVDPVEYSWHTVQRQAGSAGAVSKSVTVEDTQAQWYAGRQFADAARDKNFEQGDTSVLECDTLVLRVRVPCVPRADTSFDNGGDKSGSGSHGDDGSGGADVGDGLEEVGGSGPQLVELDVPWVVADPEAPTTDE